VGGWGAPADDHGHLVLDGDGGGEGQRAVGHAAHVGEAENDYAEEEEDGDEEANSVVCAALSQSADWDDVGIVPLPGLLLADRGGEASPHGVDHTLQHSRVRRQHPACRDINLYDFQRLISNSSVEQD
jgi:hypothetical protein